MESSFQTSPPRSTNRWFGRGAWVALAVFLTGRLALEPLRDEPHFDDRGMDGFATTENYLLRKNPNPVSVAFFGSSQSVWAILSDDVAADMGEDPARVRNLAVEGGTPFDMWNLLRRNEDKFKDLRLAIIEVNPFVLKQGLDSDPRVAIDIAQYGSLHERLMVNHRSDRVTQMAEYALPLLSVRRSLRSAFLNVVDPDPGFAPYPGPEQRMYPAVGWKVDGHPHVIKERQTVAPEIAARRMVGAWRVSKLQDYALRQSLAWFAAHKVRVIFHEPPIHPEVIRAVHANPLFEQGHQDFHAYVDALEPAPFARIITPDPADCHITVKEMADRTHLNQLGAAIYSHELATRLMSHLAPVRASEAAGSPSL
jgi:hypothetical protein